MLVFASLGPVTARICCHYNLAFKKLFGTISIQWTGSLEYYRTKYFLTRSKMCCGDVFVSMCFTDDVGADIVSEPCYCVFLHLR